MNSNLFGYGMEEVALIYIIYGQHKRHMYLLHVLLITQDSRYHIAHPELS